MKQMNRPSTFDPVDEMGSARDLRSNADAKTSEAVPSAPLIAAIYREAADTIANPDNYVIGFTARRPDVNPEFSWACFARDPRANRWGMSGAIEKAAYKRKLTPRQAVGLAYGLAAQLGARRLTDWAENPLRTHVEVVAALRSAAELADGALERQSPDAGSANVLNEKGADQ